MAVASRAPNHENSGHRRLATTRGLLERKLATDCRDLVAQPSNRRAAVRDEIDDLDHGNLAPLRPLEKNVDRSRTRGRRVDEPLCRGAPTTGLGILDDERLPQVLSVGGLFVLGHTKRDTLSVPAVWHEVKVMKHGDSMMRFLGSSPFHDARDEEKPK